MVGPSMSSYCVHCGVVVRLLWIADLGRNLGEKVGGRGVGLLISVCQNPLDSLAPPQSSATTMTCTVRVVATGWWQPRTSSITQGSE